MIPALRREGYEVHVFNTGADAIAWASAHEPDIVVFDGASMRSSGVRNCRRLRQLLVGTPIIHTRLAGAHLDDDAGADVYLMKPYTPRKVLNRVRSLLPADSYDEEVVRAGDLTFFVSKPSVSVTGTSENQLTPKQACLLEEFLRHPNQVLTRRQLMRNVWQTDYVGDTRTLDVHIRWVREAIEENPSQPKRLITVRGVGYILQVPPQS